MQRTFKNCRNLTSVDFSFLDLSEVFDFTEALYGCASLRSIDLEVHAFIGAYYMDKMFYGCTNVENISLPFTMANLIHAKNIFEGCVSLKVFIFLN